VNLSSSGAPVSYTNKNDRQDITEILLKVALNTISQPDQTNLCVFGIQLAEILLSWR
jgi:hypothetical protein